MAKTYFARLKPYNPRLGHLLKGIYIAPLGRVLHGGDGISEIPVWHEVTEEQAILLGEMYQEDGNPGTPKAFDIVDAETKTRIDQAEELARKAALGLIVAPTTLGESRLKARTIQAMPGSTPHAASPAELAAVLPEKPPARITSEQPSMIAGTEAFAEAAEAVQAAVAKEREAREMHEARDAAVQAHAAASTRPVVGSGRAAAARVATPAVEHAPAAPALPRDADETSIPQHEARERDAKPVAPVLAFEPPAPPAADAPPETKKRGRRTR